MEKTTFAVIVGNRDFFPDELVTEARQDILLQAVDSAIAVPLPKISVSSKDRLP